MVHVDVEKKTTSGDSFYDFLTSSIVFLDAFASIRTLSSPSFLR